MTPSENSSSLFDDQGHLNDMGMAVCLNALLKASKKKPFVSWQNFEISQLEIPPELNTHLGVCKQCRQRVFQLYLLERENPWE